MTYIYGTVILIYSKRDHGSRRKETEEEYTRREERHSKHGISISWRHLGTAFGVEKSRRRLRERTKEKRRTHTI